MQNRRPPATAEFIPGFLGGHDCIHILFKLYKPLWSFSGPATMAASCIWFSPWRRNVSPNILQGALPTGMDGACRPFRASPRPSSGAIRARAALSRLPVCLPAWLPACAGVCFGLLCLALLCFALLSFAGWLVWLAGWPVGWLVT